MYSKLSINKKSVKKIQDESVGSKTVGRRQAAATSRQAAVSSRQEGSWQPVWMKKQVSMKSYKMSPV